MPLIVQKFGGSSVADPEKILAAARKAIRTQQQGNQVVMVVSAMGDTTDNLIELADAICERPPAREMDMLLSTGEQISVALMAMAIRATLICSPVDNSMSISRAGGRSQIASASSIKLSVVSPMALTTITT